MLQEMATKSCQKYLAEIADPSIIFKILARIKISTTVFLLMKALGMALNDKRPLKLLPSSYFLGPIKFPT